MASERTFVQPSIPRFDGQNEHWSMLMENFLRLKEYWQVIEYGVETPDNIMALTNVERVTGNDVERVLLQALRFEFETIIMKPDEPVLLKHNLVGPVLTTLLCRSSSSRALDSAANKEEPVRRGLEAGAPGSTLRRSS
nr:hypothetical protein [Tanacetum cinerariifolium]